MATTKFDKPVGTEIESLSEQVGNSIISSGTLSYESGYNYNAHPITVKKMKNGLKEFGGGQIKLTENKTLSAWSWTHIATISSEYYPAEKASIVAMLINDSDANICQPLLIEIPSTGNVGHIEIAARKQTISLNTKSIIVIPGFIYR